MICLCFLLFGFVGCNSSENHISKELYEKGLSHNSKLFLLQYEQEYDEIPKEINSFKEYVKANNFENNDKIFIETINNIDSLYDKILLTSILSKINDDLERRETQIKIELLQNEGEKFLESKNIQKMLEYNSSFNERLKIISSKYMDRLEIVEGWKWINDGDYTYIKGRVKNISDVSVDYFKLTAEYIDSNGNVLDTDYTNSGETIRPGNQKEFEIMHRVDNEYTKVKIFIDEVK